MNDTLEDLLKTGRLRPVPGSLIGMKWRPPLIDTPMGKVKGVQGEGGLVGVQFDSPEAALTDETTVMIVALGETPVVWRSRFGFTEWDHQTSWYNQRIEVGTLVYARGVAQAPLGKESDFVQLRYDDIAGIAIPLNEEVEDLSVPCVPAPGFLLVRKQEYEGKVGSLIVKAEAAEVLQEGAGMWGTIAAFPRDDNMIRRDGLKLGQRVLFSRYQLTEYVDLEGGFRLLPYEDVLTVEEDGTQTPSAGASSAS